MIVQLSSPAPVRLFVPSDASEGTTAWVLAGGFVLVAGLVTAAWWWWKRSEREEGNWRETTFRSLARRMKLAPASTAWLVRLGATEETGALGLLVSPARLEAVVKRAMPALSRGERREVAQVVEAIRAPSSRARGLISRRRAL